MNLFKRELKKNLVGFFIWSLTLSLLVILTMSMFTSVAKSSVTLNQFMKQFPQAMLKAFNLGTLSIANILGYYSSNVSLLIILSIGIYAMILGCNMFAKEFNEKTIEFLQSKPITRTSIITSKICCCTIYIFLLNIILFAVTYFSFEIVKTSNYSVKTLFLIHVGYFIAEITFADIGILISLTIKNKKSSSSLSLWFVLGMYFIYILSGLSDKADFLKYFTPFKYVDTTDIVSNGYIKAEYVIILTCLNILTVAASYIIYNRKDV